MPPDGLDFAPRRFSTAAFPQRQRLMCWREMFGRQAVRSDIEPRSADPFKAEAVVRVLPGLRSTTFVSAPARLERTAHMVADGNDALVLLVSRKGTLAASQRGREALLRPGTATLLLHAEPSAVTHGHIHFQGFIVPRRSIAALVPNVEDAAMRPVARDNGSLRLLTSYVKTISGNVSAGSPELRNLVTTHIHDLIAVIVGASRDGAAIAEERGVAAARLAAIKADIIEHVGSDDLALLVVAARHGLTPRTVQRLFERDGTSFSAFRLEQRLIRSRRMLRDQRYAEWTVGAVALAAGFGDLSYFHRIFRRRFGATPADVRAGATWH